MIELKNVTKVIKNNTILSDISYSFEDGKVYGLYGQNGSGKTMLLRAIAGLIIPNTGEIYINSKRLHSDLSFPENAGIVIENMELLPRYTAFENLKLLSKINKIATEKDIKNSLARVGLDPDSKKKVKKFSLGMKQRLNVAQAIFENQSIILLDEPTNALDEEGVQLIYKLIKEEKDKGSTIIIATHHKEDLAEMCDVTIRMSQGRIVDKEVIN